MFNHLGDPWICGGEIATTYSPCSVPANGIALRLLSKSEPINWCKFTCSSRPIDWWIQIFASWWAGCMTTTASQNPQCKESSYVFAATMSLWNSFLAVARAVMMQW
jgi:hypothetical protein